MRVIGGYLKGQKILEPTDKSTRPLKDRVRESIFNIIEHSNNETINLKGAKILDLFAGTGSFGIECLSRGAEKVVFFENYHQSNMLLKKNLEKFKLLKKASVYQSDSYKFNEENIFDNKFDIIFLDPPFKDKNIETIIDKIKKKEAKKHEYPAGASGGDAGRRAKERLDQREREKYVSPFKPVDHE